MHSSYPYVSLAKNIDLFAGSIRAPIIDEDDFVVIGSFDSIDGSYELSVNKGDIFLLLIRGYDYGDEFFYYHGAVLVL